MRHWIHTTPLGAACVLGMAVAAAGPRPAVAQDASAAGQTTIEELVVLGSRGAPRAAMDTPVPVDVFSSEAIESVASSDMVDVIGQLVPSFNVSRQPISDGASFVRPIQLRGLDTHHTLVLVNGQRRHRSALLQLGGFGAHGPDVGTIPSSAVANVEVLRDGAAAQYGTDAIAGVLNFNLKEIREGGDVSVRFGEYDAGDGRELIIDGAFGLPLGRDGFLTISGQYADVDATSRSVLYNLPGPDGRIPSEIFADDLAGGTVINGANFFGPDNLTITRNEAGEVLDIQMGPDGVPDDLDNRFVEFYPTVNGPGPFSDVEQPWGQPARDQWMLFFNAGLPINEQLELYAFGNYSEKDQISGFFHRRTDVPQLRPVRLEDGTLYNPRDELYPAGFTPQFGADVADLSLAFGGRGDLDNGLAYDVSAFYGRNKIDYVILNTMNPSMGPDTPTEFSPGTLKNEEWSLNANFVTTFDAGLASPVTLAFGGEYREEKYTLGLGDEASFTVGPFAFPDPFGLCEDPTQARPELVDFIAAGCEAGTDPALNALPVGSNGFPGYSPQVAGSEDRNSWAIYTELEADITPDWLVNAALRYEDYSDFGDVAIWKLATRYSLTPNINLRGSVGTGFRAPTIGQIATTNVSTRIAPDGFPVAEGVFPSTSAAAGLFGGDVLDAEDSFSYTLGLTASPLDSLTLTLDYYYIELDDRIVLSSAFTVGPEEVAQLEALGVEGANTIGQVRFFTNDVDSETWGVDFVADYALESDFGTTRFGAAVNYNKTKITRAGDFISAQDQFNREKAQPRTRGNITVRHAWNDFDVMARARYYASYTRAENAALSNIQDFSSKTFFDLEASYNFMENYRVTLGAQNIFDTFPTRTQFQCCGRAYDSASIVPWQGAFYYLRASASF